MAYEKPKNRWQQEIDLNKRRTAAIKSLLMHVCVNIYNKYGIKKAILFGSLINQNFDKRSDVNIFVQSLDNDNEEYWEFQHNLEDMLNLKMDLRTNKDDPSLVMEILSRGEVIYKA